MDVGIYFTMGVRQMVLKLLSDWYELDDWPEKDQFDEDENEE